jgi:3-hydroxybutyrate dehydrogenase
MAECAREPGPRSKNASRKAVTHASQERLLRMSDARTTRKHEYEPSEREVGRVALVTGAAGGLGKAICDALERDGADLVRVDLRGDDCLHFDAATDDGTRSMVDAALKRHGRLDVLVLNAGVQFMAPLPEFPEHEWDRVMNVLVKGPYLAIRHAWPALIARPGGRIVVTASALSYVAEPFKAAYVAAKHGVLGLVKVAALEGGPHGLTANAVAPGRVWTPLVANQVADYVRLRGVSEEQVLEEMLARYPARRFVEAEEVADTVVFLASAKASAITGACLPVDLAYTAG